MKKILLVLFLSFQFTNTAAAINIAPGQFTDIRATNAHGMKVEVEVCRSGNVPAVQINDKLYGEAGIGTSFINYLIPFPGDENNIAFNLNIDIQPCEASDSISFRINGDTYSPARAAELTERMNGTFIPEANKNREVAAAGGFADIHVNNVDNVVFEVQRCVSGNIPYVTINGKEYGDFFLGGPNIIQYKIPLELGSILSVGIQPCEASDSISFRINGATFTPAAAARETRNINNEGGDGRVLDDTDDGTGGGGDETTTTPKGDGDAKPNPLDDPNEIDTVQDVLNVIDRLTNWLFTIFIAAAVIMVLIAAFKYLTSGGGEETAKAHKMILYAAVAIAVALLAKGVVNVVQSIVKP